MPSSITPRLTIQGLTESKVLLCERISIQDPFADPIAKTPELETQSPGRTSYFRPSSLGPFPPSVSFSSIPVSSFLS